MCAHVRGPHRRRDRRRSLRRAVVRSALVFFAAAAATANVSAGQQLIAGANVNMGGGPACTKDQAADCPSRIYGDVSLQRQNEGSMACSSRNPTTCLAAGNDYRLVNVPGVDDGKVTADSWLGIYWTRNGGSTWRSTLLSGWKTSVPSFFDNSPEGDASPIRELEASADPTVRAGTHGLFYVSGIAFNRAGENASAPASGVQGKKGVQFVAVFIDDNNTSDPDVPPRYLWTALSDTGTSGQFLDKPWLAVDIPRGTAGCTIPAGAGGVPAQTTIPAGAVYVAYATFLGEGNNPHSEIWVKKSSDCGQTWGSAAKLTASVPLSQSPIVAIDPANGNVHVVWREFGTGGSNDRILASKSTNFGKTFTKPVVVHDLGAPAPLSTAYDQYTLPSFTEPHLRMARTNDYPALCVGTDGLLRVLFSKRLQMQTSRIVLTTSPDGTAWSAPVPLDNHAGPGHQFQPSIACTGLTSTALWLDQRNDNAFWLLNAASILEYVLGPFVRDLIGRPPTHTIDSRAALEAGRDAAGIPLFGSSIQVSRYQVRYDGASFRQLQFNPWNLPLFASGVVPFNGDYPEIIARNPFRPPLGPSGWVFNDYADESPVFHAVWTDNRDVLRDPLSAEGAIDDQTFRNFGAPGTGACTPGNLTWTRNQNLYTATLGTGLVMQAEGNARRSPNALKHGYVIRMQNLAPPAAGVVEKRFRVSLAHGTGHESFDWRVEGVADIDVTIPAFSSVARTVFIPTGSATSFEVKAVEIGPDGQSVNSGLKGRTVIVPDPTAPEDPATAAGETHDVLLAPLTTLYSNKGEQDPSYTYANPAHIVGAAYTQEEFLANVRSPSYITPSYITPSYITPSYITPSYITPSYITPSYITPSYITPSYITPSYVTPSYITPSYITPSYITPSYITMPVVTDANYLAINTGNVTSGYDVSAILQALPADAVFQLQVNGLYAEPSPERQDGATPCGLGRQVGTQSLANVTTLGGGGAATFSLGPREFAIITLRVACQTGPCFDPTSNLTIAVRAQAPNCDGSACAPIPDTDIIDHGAPVLTLPAAVSAPATSPAGAAVTFAVSANDVIDGPVVPACTPASGAQFPVGTTTVTCSATDSRGNVGIGTFTVTVTNAPPTANNQGVTVAEDTPATIVLTASDVEGDPVTFKVWSLPQHGSLSQAGGRITVVPTQLTGGMVTYTPAPNYNGSDAFTFKATDQPHLQDSAGGVVSITVTPVNDAPVAAVELDGGTVASGETKQWTVTELASDIDSTLTIQQVTQAPLQGTVTITGNGRGIAYTAGTFAGEDRFTYVVTDGMFSASTTLKVRVTYGTPFLFNGPLNPYGPPPKAFNTGSSLPIIWQYSDAAGQVVDSSYALAASLVTLTFTRLTWGDGIIPPPDCRGGTDTAFVQISTDYPGNSFFQYFTATNPHLMYGAYTWQFNWQTGPPVQAGCWRVRVILDANGNNASNPAAPDAADLVREFLIKLK